MTFCDRLQSPRKRQFEVAFKRLQMRMSTALAGGCGSMEGRGVVDNVEEVLRKLPDESPSFVS